MRRSPLADDSARRHALDSSSTITLGCNHPLPDLARGVAGASRESVRGHLRWKRAVRARCSHDRPFKRRADLGRPARAASSVARKHRGRTHEFAYIERARSGKFPIDRAPGQCVLAIPPRHPAPGDNSADHADGPGHPGALQRGGLAAGVALLWRVRSGRCFCGAAAGRGRRGGLRRRGSREQIGAQVGGRWSQRVGVRLLGLPPRVSVGCRSRRSPTACKSGVGGWSNIRPSMGSSKEVGRLRASRTVGSISRSASLPCDRKLQALTRLGRQDAARRRNAACRPRKGKCSTCSGHGRPPGF